MLYKHIKNTSEEELTLIIKGVGESQNFINKIYSNLLINLLEEKNDSDKKIKDLLQFTLINRINILQQNCINIFTNTTMKNDVNYSYNATDISMNLNSFYFQLSGLIDNIGWYIEYKYEILDLNLNDEKNRKEVGLSKKRNKNFFKELKIKNKEKYLILIKYQNWIKELHEKRDPITRRMPLYVPPTVIINDEMKFIPIYSLNSNIFMDIIPSIIDDSFKLHNLCIAILEK